MITLLPVELQDIILRYAGIYYPKNLEQGLFSYNQDLLPLFISKINNNYDDLHLLFGLYHNFLDCLLTQSIINDNIACLRYAYCQWPEIEDLIDDNIISLVVENTSKHCLVFFTQKQYYDLEILTLCIKFNRLDLLQIAISINKDHFCNLLYTAKNHPEICRFLLSHASDQQKLSMMYSAISHYDLTTIEFLVSQNIYPDTIAMILSLDTNFEIISVIDRYLVDKNERIILELFHKDKYHYLSFFIQHNYALPKNLLLLCLNHKIPTSMINQCLEAHCYKDPQLLQPRNYIDYNFIDKLRQERSDVITLLKSYDIE